MGAGGGRFRLVVVLATAVLCLALLAASVSTAEAAQFETFVVCSADPGGPLRPAHACTTGQQPKAFFESDTAVTVHTCLVGPTGREHCGADLVAQANQAYSWTITTTLLGKFDFRWFVEGVEVGNWPFEMLTEEEMEEGPRSQRTLLACARGSFANLVYVAHPHHCEDLVEAEGTVEAALMRGVRWREWNSPSAQGQGLLHYCGRHRCFSGPARIAAYDRKFACGRYAYTRLLIHMTVAHRGKGHSQKVIRAKLPPC